MNLAGNATKPAAPSEPSTARIDPMQDPLRPTFARLGPPDEHPAERVLRALACWLGVGGFNAPTVDADLFHRRIVSGIEELLKAQKAAPSVSEVPVHAMTLSLLESEREQGRLRDALKSIGDYAHDHSTGPAVPDALWEVRAMAYDAMAEGAKR